MTQLDQILAAVQRECGGIIALETTPEWLIEVTVGKLEQSGHNRHATCNLVIGELALGRPNPTPNWPTSWRVLLAVPGLQEDLLVIAASRALAAWSIQVFELVEANQQILVFGQVVDLPVRHDPFVPAGLLVDQTCQGESDLETLNRLVLLDGLLTRTVQANRHKDVQVAELQASAMLLESQLANERSQLATALPKARRYDQIRSMSALKPGFWLARKVRGIRRRS